MKLSILIPMYNAGSHIGKCLDSLITQDLPKDEYEIIVMNDGSTDNSAFVVENYTQAYPNILLYTSNNCGAGVTRNKAMKLAKGDYIYFIDSDDYLAENTLGSIIKAAKKNNLDILTFKSKRAFNYDLVKSETHLEYLPSAQIKSGINYIGDVGFKNEVWWYIIKREFLKNSGVEFIEGRWMEDGIFTVNLFLEAKFISHFAIDAHRYVKMQDSAMTSKKTLHYIKVINDMHNAACLYDEIISRVRRSSNEKKACIDRLKARQQSYVFFMMVRMLKSTIKLKEVKSIINDLNTKEIYPLNNFIGNDYKDLKYRVLVNILNIKPLFYFLFVAFNPILRKL